MFENELFNYFLEVDIILLEGFKYFDYFKIEVVRKGILKDYICKRESLIVIVIDLECKFEGIKIININNIEKIIEVLFNECKEV